LYFKMPKILGVNLTGKLADWVSAKDVILEMLRRYDVHGCKGMIVEYYGSGLKGLSAMDRHVIANMGTELGATTTVFPSDEQVLKFLQQQEREQYWIELKADEEAKYDLYDVINLSELEPMIACPSSPGNVVKVREVEGKPIGQAVVGSSANPGFRDFWIVGEILKGKIIHQDVSLDINPTSRQIIENLISTSSFASMIKSGGRFHQAGCLGCIGMGQAPATNKISLRTMPRNFPGRSGTVGDLVYLCSPETAAASALTGKITDPRDLEKIYKMNYPQFIELENSIINKDLLLPPPRNRTHLVLEKGPNIKLLPEFTELIDECSVPALLKLNDNISTDEILKAGVHALSFRSNIPEISKSCYVVIDENYYSKALTTKEKFGGHIIVAGENYAQGSSREHAAIAPRYLGQIAVIAKSYARIGWQNMANFGIVPFEFLNKEDYDTIDVNDFIRLENIRKNFEEGTPHFAFNKTKKIKYSLKHDLSQRQIKIILSGGAINYFRLNSKKVDG